MMPGAASLGAGVGGAVIVVLPVPIVSGEVVETPGSGVAAGVGAPDPVPCPYWLSNGGMMLRASSGWK